MAVLPSGGFVVLDLRVTPELEREGVARDLVRAVQQVRRDAGLAVGDRIHLAVETDDATVVRAVEEFRELLAHETLALEVRVGADVARPAPDAARAEVTLGNGLGALVLVGRDVP